MESADPILLLGDGDGRFLSELLKVNPRARITSIDCSPGMISRACQRIERDHPGVDHRVEWLCRDIREFRLPPRSHQAVVTHFFLDCFTPDEAARVHANLRQSLTPGGRWVGADFVLPESGPGHWFARACLGLLYPFFRSTTGINAHHLPPVLPLFTKSGLKAAGTRRFLFGTIESTAWTDANKP